MNRLILYISILLLAVFGCTRHNDPAVFDLRCEDLHNPLGIDKITPRYSWKVGSQRNSTEQTSYQILVASDLSRLSEKRADLWNSGQIAGGSSVLVPFRGEKLSSGVNAWWKVRVWDEAGNVSAWSEPARFSVGLLDECDWQASYVAYNTELGYRECPQVYTSFEVAGKPSGYLLHVNSLGYHEVYVNGRKAGNGVLAPAVSQFDKRSLVNTYDVTSLLKKGKNDLIIWLGSGWYTEGLPGVVNSGPVVKAQLEKVDKGRREVVAATGAGWKARKSSYTRHGNWRPNRFGGEIVDGALAATDLLTDNPANPWQAVSLVQVPPHAVTPQMTELNIIADTIRPASVIHLAADTFLVDMGTNLTGWLEYRFPKLQKQQEVRMEYCDHLVDGVRFNDRGQYDHYVASGESPERFINRFNYHGFRYVRITGLKEMPHPDSIRAYLVHTGFEQASGFVCSDPDMNQIHDMLMYTLRCLSIGGDFVDCPQIERLGYGGDGNASTLTAQTMFNVGPLYNNWLQAWADVIREDGGMPHTAPNPYKAGGGPYWCGFIVTASWNTFLNYGDTLVLSKYYPVMQHWLEYVEAHSVDGLLKRWPDTEYRGWYLGDWATPTGIDQTAEASVDVVNNSFIAVCFDKMERIARVLGREADAKGYAEQKALLQRKIHDTYFHESGKTYGTGTQIDLAFPMIAGVVPEDTYGDVVNALMIETETNRNGHLSCGLVGLPVITEWAVENEAPGWMYSMLKKREYPGFLFMIDNGATTTWEHWNGARSHIHNCYNGIGTWFYQAIGGIRPVEDVQAYRKVRIQPQIPEGITWARTWKETPVGRLAVNWEIVAGHIEFELNIPVGMEAEVTLPSGTAQYLLDGTEYSVQDISANGISLKSGKYKISYAM